MRPRLWGILLALFLLSVHAQSPRPAEQTHKTGNNKPSAPSNVPLSPSTPTVSEPITQINAAVQEGNSKDDSHSAYYDWFWPPVWSTWVAAIAAGVAACAAFKTLKAINQQTRVLVRQTRAIEIQASANSSSADATKRSVDVLINGERAWVVVSRVWPLRIEAAPRQGLSDTGYNELVINFKNVGRTVARLTDFHSTWRVLSRTDHLPDTPEYIGHEPSTIEPIRGRIMSPRQVIGGTQIIIYEGFDSERLARLTAGDLILWVYAYVEYIDFSNETRRNQFCYRYVVNRDHTVQFMIAGPKNYNTHT